MNREKIVPGTKLKRDLSRRDNRSKPEWNNRFSIAKIPDYNKVKEKISFLKIYRNNLTPSEKKTFKPLNDNDPDYNLSIDPEIITQWNELGVTSEYRLKFAQKLTYFNESFHSHFYEIEKKTLKQIIVYLNKINTELNVRDKSLACLRDVSAVLLKENNNKITAEIKTALINIKITMSNIITYLKKVRKKTQYSILKGKFNIDKMKFGYILEPTFVVKINNDLQFIREGPIGRLFNLSGEFDPLLIEFEEKNDAVKVEHRVLIDNSYTLFHEMIYNNLIFNKSLSRLSLSTVQLKVLTKTASRMRMPGMISSSLDYSEYGKGNVNDKFRNVNHKETRNRTKEDFKGRTNDKESIYCRSKEECIQGNNHNQTVVLSKKDDNKDEMSNDLNVPEVKDDYIINDKDSKELPKVKGNNVKDNKTAVNKANNDKKPVMSFFIKQIGELIPLYNEYYKTIPNKQKNVFHIESDVKKYFEEGINTLVITHYYKSTKEEDSKGKDNNSTTADKSSDKAKLASLCIVSTDTDNNNLLYIKHLSSNLNEDLSYIFTQIISFIKDNVPYKELAINLYYNNSKGKDNVVQEEMSILFQQLNFQWMKMNHSLFQTVKYKNNNDIASNTSTTTSLEIKSAIMSCIRPSANDTPETDPHKVNTLNKQMIYSLITKSNSIEDIKDLLRCIEVFEGIEEEAIKFLLVKGFNKEDFIPLIVNSKQQTYLSCFKLLPSFKSISTKKIGNYIYNRIASSCDIILDKETNQTLYILHQKDYCILIGEITSAFNQYLTSQSNNNINEALSVVYSKMECIADSKKTILWLPSFTLCNKSFSAHEDNSKIVLSSLSTANLCHCLYYFNTICFEQRSEDIFISNSFIFAMVSSNGNSINTNTNTKSHIIFSSVIDSTNWNCSD